MAPCFRFRISSTLSSIAPKNLIKLTWMHGPFVVCLVLHVAVKGMQLREDKNPGTFAMISVFVFLDFKT